MHSIQGCPSHFSRFSKLCRNVRRGVGLAWGIALCLGAARVHAQGLVETVIAHYPTPVHSLSINDAGWVTWSVGLGLNSQVYVWDGINIWTLGFPGQDNLSPSINNNNYVVFDARRPNGSLDSDIYLWKGGGVATSLTNDYNTTADATINDHNDIAWWGQKGGLGIGDVFYLAHDALTGLRLTDSDSLGDKNAGPKLNNNGLITWEHTTDNGQGGATNLVRASLAPPINVPLSFTQITNLNDPNLLNGGINASGKLVWEQYNDTKLQFDVWQYDPVTKKTKNLSANLTGNSHAPSLANDGTVAWKLEVTGSSKLYWDKGTGAQLIPVSQPFKFNRPVALNNSGGLVYASGSANGTGTGQGFDIILVQPSTKVMVGGAVTLQDCDPTHLAQPLTFEFRPTDNSGNFTRTQTLNANGNFNLAFIPAKNYKVWIKGSKWLATEVAVDASGGSVFNVTATLLGGDADGNNVVDFDDLTILAIAYNTAIGDSLYDARADFNCDGQVEFADLTILAINYNLNGDP